AGNAEALVRCFDGLTPDMTTNLKQIAAGVCTVNQLKEALTAKVGDAKAKALVMPLGILPPIDYNSLQRSKTTTQGDTAQLTVQRLGAIPFKKVGNAWLFTSETARMFPSIFVHIDPFLPEIRKFTQDVKAGKYVSEHDLHIG